MKAFLASVFIVFLLLPFEGFQIELFGIPIYLVEIAVCFSAIAFLFAANSEPPKKKWEARQSDTPWSIPRVFVFGIISLLVGVASSLFAASLGSAACTLSLDGLRHALGILKSWFIFPILFGMFIFLVSHRRFLRDTMIFIFAVSFIPFGIFSLLGLYFGSYTTFDGRFESTFNSPNALALFLTPAFLLSWYFLRARTSRLLWTIAILIFSILLFASRSYSAWIAVSGAIILFEILEHRSATRKGFLLLGATVAVFAGIFFSQRHSPRLESFFDTDSRSSFASRVMIWKAAGKMIADSPIFGIGPGNFQSCYLSYQRFFPPYLEWSAPQPHNVFLAFWLESGLIGLCSFLFLLAFWFRDRVVEHAKKGSPSASSILTAIMFATLIHGLFDTPYWRLSLAYLFWIVFFLGIIPEENRTTN